MRTTLTDAWLRAMKPPATGRTEIRDAKAPGLVLRVTAGGAATWSCRGVLADGRHGRVTLGAYPALGLAEARRLATAARAAVQAGADPVGERKAERAKAAARRAAPTVTERWKEWQAAASRSAMRGRGWSDSHATRVAWLLDKVVAPAIGDRPLAETTRADWAGLVTAAQRERGPAAAANFLRIARAFANHAEAAGWVDLPLFARKASILAPATAPRDRVLSDAELAAIWTGTEALSAKPRAFARLLILTAARRGEVADIALGEVDRQAGTWRLPPARSKNRSAHAMPLHALALDALAEVWPEDAADLDPDHRLLGRMRGSGLSGFSKIKAALDTASGVTDWDWHDLRRTARTGLSRLGVAREAAEAALNHIGGRAGLVAVYDLHDFQAEAMGALRRWQDHVAALVTKAPQPAAGKVVALRSRTRAA